MAQAAQDICDFDLTDDPDFAIITSEARRMTDRTNEKGPKTKQGYDLYECLSALQKDIRRANEVEAMYWATELATSGYEVVLWNRLCTIAHEDIGAADWSVIPFIEVCRQHYFSGRVSRQMVLGNAILRLSRSPKSRIGDEFSAFVVDRMARGLMCLPIPDYALDKHTKRGKAMGRGMAYFLSEGAKLEPVSDVHNPYTEAAKQAWLLQEDEKRHGLESPKLQWPKLKSGGEEKAQQATGCQQGEAAQGGSPEAGDLWTLF